MTPWTPGLVIIIISLRTYLFSVYTRINLPARAALPGADNSEKLVIENHFSGDLYRVIRVTATYLLGISEFRWFPSRGGLCYPGPFVNATMNAAQNIIVYRY